MFINILHYFKFVEKYFLHASLEKIYVPKIFGSITYLNNCFKFNGKILIIKSIFVTCNNLRFIPYIFLPLILEFRTEITNFE